MDEGTNVIDFPTAAQPMPAPVLPFDTVEELQTALTWMGQLIEDSRAAAARVPYISDPVSPLESWVELALAVTARGPQYGDEAVLQGLEQIFTAASRLAGR